MGARDYDPRIGRWKSVDPLAGKYPNESPFIFVGNIPLIYVDPNGEEKVVIIGGGDDTQKDRFKFFNSGLLGAKQYLSKNSNENVTILITDIFVAEGIRYEMKKNMKALNAEFNRRLTVKYVKNGDEITNYLNSKTTSSGTLSDARSSDQITDLSFFGHGYRPQYSSEGLVGAFEPAHGVEGEYMTDYNNRPMHSMWSWGADDVSNLDASAFATGGAVDFYSCNSANCNASGDKLVKDLSTKLGNEVTVSGYAEYATIYKGEGADAKGGIRPSQSLPSAGSDANNYSKKAPWVQYKNGNK